MKAALSKVRATTFALLIAVAALTGFIAIVTFRAPSNYLYGQSFWWGLLCVAISLTCVLTAVSQKQFWGALSGTLLVFLGAGRALVNFFASQYTVDDDPDLRTWATTFGFVWALVAVLSFDLWRQVVIPWTIQRERERQRYGTTDRPAR